MASVRKQYLNPRLSGSYSGASGFMKNRNFKDKDKVKGELSTLRAYMLHAPARKTYPRQRIIIPFIDRQWVSDLLDMQKYVKENRGYRYILILLDGLSRFLFTVPLKDKTGPSLVRAFKKVLRSSKRSPQYLQVDQGTEYLNREFRAFLKEHKIKLFHTFSKLKSVLAERLIRTLRSKIERYFTHTGHGKYIDALPSLTASYNATWHSSIKMAPRQVNKENELDVWLNLYGGMTEAALKATPAKPKFSVGNQVRISREKLVFEKGYKINWSEEIFRIKKVNKTIPITYRLEDLHKEEISGGFYEPELQLYSSSLPEHTSTKRTKVAPPKPSIPPASRQSTRIRKTPRKLLD